MNSQSPRSALYCATLITLTVSIPAAFAQQVQADSIPVKNWSILDSRDQASIGPRAAVGSASGLVFISITPCRVMDTRGQGGSGKTGPFGSPSLAASQARVVP